MLLAKLLLYCSTIKTLCVVGDVGTYFMKQYFRYYIGVENRPSINISPSYVIIDAASAQIITS